MFRSFFVFVALASLPAAALSVAGPPPPPLGWEESIAPGFDPPIEETLVFSFHAAGPKRKQFAAAWGARALPVLSRLQADPMWSEYKGVIQAYISLLGGEVSEEAQEKFVLESFARISVGEDVEVADSQSLFHIAPNATDAMREIVRDGYAAADEKRQSRMTYWVAVFAGDRRIQFLESCLAVAKGDANREQVNQLIESTRARNRAREPMSTILNAQREEEPQS